LAILLAALLRTGSRAGVVSSLVGLLVVVGPALWRRRERHLWPARRLGILAAILAVTLLAGGPFIARVTNPTENLGDRTLVFRDTLAAILDRPLLGHGAGGFPAFFPIYRGPQLSPDFTWLSSHSLYLDAVAGLGLPALAFSAAVGVYLLLPFVRSLVSDPNPAGLAALGAIALVAAHSTIDYSLEIQGVAIPFAILAGAGIARALTAQGDEKLGSTDPALAASLVRRDPSRFLAGILLLVLTLGTLRLVVTVFGAPPLAWLGGVRALVGDASFSESAIQRADRASRLVSSGLHFPVRYGDCPRWPDASRTAVSCAAVLDEALASMPSSGELWLEKSRLLLLSGRQEDGLSALNNSYVNAPNEGWIAIRRAKLVLSLDLPLPENLRVALQHDVDLVLRSSTLSANLARAYAEDPVVLSNLTPVLEASADVEGVLRFVEIVRRVPRS
jgi:hypothetical protein